MTIAEEFDRLGGLAATMGTDARIFHTGFVVPDLDATIADMKDTLGVVFMEPLEIAGVTLHSLDGTREDDITVRFAYSTRPCHIELIERVASKATFWSYDSRLRGHHIGVFTDDVAAEAGHLDSRGWEKVWWGTAPDGTMVFSLHETPYGFAVELVSSAGKEIFAQLFSQADPDIPGK